MKKKILSLALALGLLMTFAAGCGKPAESSQTTSPSTTSTQATQPTTNAPTDPTKATTPPETQPSVTVPTETQPIVTEPSVTEPPATEPEPEPEPEPTPDNQLQLTVCIDAGHQRRGITEKEPNGPGSDVMKAKLTSGTQGVSTKLTEYQLNLDVSLLLEQELLSRGYNVVMIRRTNDCPLSNAERAQQANESGADIFVRIHANGSDNSQVSGALCCAPTKSNPYLTDDVINESIRLSRLVVDNLCTATGANNQGILSTDTMTGINWCEIPVTIVEMGYMSNPTEDKLMATEAYQKQIVLGIADGIDAYFAE